MDNHRQPHAPAALCSPRFLAFTLAELPFVIATIVILAGLVLSALRQHKATALSVPCTLGP